MKRRSHMRACLLAGWLLSSACALLPIPAVAVPHAGDAAPAFTVAGAHGRKIALQSFAGKPRYLDFFASWCGPCNTEAASVARLYRKYHKRGLAVIGIDEEEPTSSVLAFARKYGWSFPIALDDGSLAATYGAEGLPIHVFIDKRGKINAYRLGVMSPSEIESAIRLIL